MNVTEIQTAALTAAEAAQNLAVAAQAAVEGKAQIDKGKAKGAAALAVMVAGFSDDSAAMRPWTFDVLGGDNTVHHHVACTGLQEYGTETAAWILNGEGKVSRVAQGAYKTGLQRAFFGLPKSVPAVWTMASKAIPMAEAIRAEGMTARIEGGALKLDGGNTDKAKAMREAKTMAALAKAAEGASGSNRETPQNDGKAEGPRPATREEILRAALAELQRVASGDAPALHESEAVTLAALAKAATSIAKAEAAAAKAEAAEAARKAARNA